MEKKSIALYGQQAQYTYHHDCLYTRSASILEKKSIALYGLRAQYTFERHVAPSPKDCWRRHRF